MNPVLRENLEVFFGEGHGLRAYFYLLATLAPIAFLGLCTPFLGAQMWSGAGNLFKVCASVAVVLVVYFALRVANREYAPLQFRPLDHWLRERGEPPGVVARGQAAFLVAHVAGSVLLIAPLLAWAAAIAHVPVAALAATLALLPFYALCYGVWGLVALALWEREADSRELVVRCFTGIVVLVSMAVFLPLNPVVYVLALAGQQEPVRMGLAAAIFPTDGAHIAFHHIAFHLVLGGAGLAAHRWVLERGR